jgi:hypothetical protein
MSRNWIAIWITVEILGGVAYNLIPQLFGSFDTKGTNVSYGIFFLLVYVLFVSTFIILHRPLIRKITARQTPGRYLKFILLYSRGPYSIPFHFLCYC